MKAGCRLRRQDHQTVVDGFGQGVVSGDGEARDFAQGEIMGIIDNAKELADLLKAAGNTELYRKIVE